MRAQAGAGERLKCLIMLCMQKHHEGRATVKEAINERYLLVLTRNGGGESQHGSADHRRSRLSERFDHPI